MIEYYTPKIEEFHVGFEYAVRYSDHGNWGPWIELDCSDAHQIFQAKSIMEGGSKKVQFRVKCLDGEDIKSLGFAHVQSTEKKNIAKAEYVTYDVFTDGKHNIGLYGDGTVVIQMKYVTVFHGTIKNKAELEFILERIK